MKTQNQYNLTPISQIIRNPDGTNSCISISIEVWGPAEAAAFLEKVPDTQRPIKSWSVERLSKSMESTGFWVNGDTFVIDDLGNSVDGQHRARAIVRTGTSHTVIVVRGVSREAYPTIDADGVSKNTGDYFRYIGIPNAKPAAGAAALIARYTKRNDSTGLLLHSSVTNRGEILDAYHDYQDKIQHYATNGKVAALAPFIKSKSTVIAVAVICDVAFGEDMVIDFLEKVISGIDCIPAISDMRSKIIRDNNKMRTLILADDRFLMMLAAARAHALGLQKSRIVRNSTKAPIVPFGNPRN